MRAAQCARITVPSTTGCSARRRRRSRTSAREAEISLFHRVGITFAVYGEEAGTERLIPFDIVPRIMPAAEWRMLETGLRQRVHALNLFIADIYGEQEILKAGRMPAEQVLANSEYRQEMLGFAVPGGIYSHIAGIDLVRAGDGEFYVLEDNLRVPSGVSYMLENRRMMMRLFPGAVRAAVDRAGGALSRRAAGESCARSRRPASTIRRSRVLTPGAHNSAYFEHAFLAQQMGVELVEGADLFVRRRCGLHAHHARPAAGDVIYRRIDDDFLDPTGVPRRFDARRAGSARRLPRRARDARQRDRAPASPTTNRSIPTCRR